MLLIYKRLVETNSRPAGRLEFLLQLFDDRRDKIRRREYALLALGTLIASWCRSGWQLACVFVETSPMEHIYSSITNSEKIIKIKMKKMYIFAKMKTKTLTIASQTDGRLIFQRIFAQNTNRAVLAILKPLHIGLHDAL